MQDAEVGAEVKVRLRWFKMRFCKSCQVVVGARCKQRERDWVRADDDDDDDDDDD